jgi:formate hydrogenlyase subunit 3/multisubunit Na+/H+ antiporter MnhD subunit
MSSLAVLMIVSCGGLVVCAATGLAQGAAWRIAAICIGLAASVVLAAAGIVAVFDERLVWQPFSWFPFGHAGVQVDSLAGLFLIITGLVSAPLFLTTRAGGPRTSHPLRPLLVLCVIGVIVVDNVFEFLILFELTVVAIYALIKRPLHRSASAARRGALV